MTQVAAHVTGEIDADAPLPVKVASANLTGHAFISYFIFSIASGSLDLRVLAVSHWSAGQQGFLTGLSFSAAGRQPAHPGAA